MPRHDPLADPRSLSTFDLDRSALRSQASVWSHESDPEHHAYLDKVRDVLPRLPALDRDLLRMYVVEGLTQRQIRAILGITQQGVCKRLASAIRRAEFLIGQPDLEAYLKPWLAKLADPERSVLEQFGKLGYQAAVAKKLGLSSQWVNCLYLRGLQTLMQSTNVQDHYLVTWFALLSMQRYIYDRDTPAISRHAAPLGRRRSVCPV